MSWWADDPVDDAKPRGPGFADAIAGIESAGSGDYRAVGPVTRTGDRALGRYQVMTRNIRPWSQEVLGREVTPQEFMADPKLQDALFEGKFGQYAEKYGPEGAAKAWFAGEKGMNNPNARDQLGTTVSAYAQKFNRGLEQQPQQAMGFAPEQAAPQFPPLTAAPRPAAPPAAANWWADDPVEPSAPVVSPEEAAKDQLAEGLRAGKTNEQEVYRAAAFRTNQGVPKAGTTEAAISGATGGFSDEASAAARAPIDMAIRGEGYNEAYQHNLAAERDRLDQYRKANPGKAIAAEVAGGFAMPVSKAAGAIKQAVGQGALYGGGNSEGDITQRASDAAVGGLASGALGGVIAGVGRAIAGKAPSAGPSIGELKAAAAKGYNSAVVKELEINPRSASDAATAIRLRLDDEGFPDVLAAKAHGILKMVEKVPEGATLTGRNLHSIQKTLGKAAGSIDPQEKAAATIALREFNEFLENVPAGSVIKGSADDFMRTMREANANYNAASQASKIDKKIVLAQDRAGAANSGQNVGNTIRQRMVDVANNPREQRGLRPEEIEMARNISRGSKTENLIRRTDRVLGGGGGMGAMVAGGVVGAGAGAYSQDPTNTILGAAGPALGLVLRGIGNRMTLRDAGRLSEAIRSRAPLASASSKFEELVARHHEQRNSRTAAAAALAARNLATNLRGSGFNVSTSDLMRALQAPVASRAEDEQPGIPGPPR